MPYISLSVLRVKVYNLSFVFRFIVCVVQWTLSYSWHCRTVDTVFLVSLFVVFGFVFGFVTGFVAGFTSIFILVFTSIFILVFVGIRVFVFVFVGIWLWVGRFFVWVRVGRFWFSSLIGGIVSIVDGGEVLRGLVVAYNIIIILLSLTIIIIILPRSYPRS